MRFFHSEKARSVPMIAVALALVACAGSQPAPTPAAEAKPAAQQAPPPAPPAAAPAPAEAPPPPVAQLEPVSIYFEFDSADVVGDARTALLKLSGQAQTRRDVDLRIEGNCDERGTTEYNLALGQRRADAAKAYLVRLGVDGSRITTISNGKEKPRAPGHDEQSWSENRRADVIPVTRAVGQASR